MQNYNSKYKSDLKDRCFKFSLATMTLVDSLPQKRSAWVITDQLLRSAMSIGANLIEGGAASSRLEYKKFYEIALKSANETRYWLLLLRDSGLAAGKGTQTLIDEVSEIASMLAAGVMKLKSKNF
ncbi:MAG: four helix bundle protein [Patescibacteria group bacterium]|nr:four helix bundle protein [Patescibacteria group bacterium]MCL5431469.1 four helix bundle protein [Patescibacteria group bacterium]